MKYFRFLLFFIPLLFVACGGDDEPKLVVDFNVACNHLTSEGLQVDITQEKNGCTLNVNPWGGEYTLDIAGVYDYFLLAEGSPEWVTVNSTASQIKLTLGTYFGETPRKVTIHFTVFKGDVSTSGFINIVQNPVTQEELIEREQYYIASVLVGKTVIEAIPTDGNFIAGKDAPFYKLSSDNNIYMQVVSVGNSGKAKAGDQVYFRFMRYRAIDWADGNLSNGTGNMNSISGDYASFVIGSSSPSTTQWGMAIPLPLSLGLPYGSEVILLVGSSAGPEAEKSYYIPYIYNIRYYQAKT